MKTLRSLLRIPITIIAYIIFVPLTIKIVIDELRDEERIFNRYGG